MLPDSSKLLCFLFLTWPDIALPEQHLPLHFQRQKAGPGWTLVCSSSSFLLFLPIFIHKTEETVTYTLEFAARQSSHVRTGSSTSLQTIRGKKIGLPLLFSRLYNRSTALAQANPLFHLWFHPGI